VSNTGEEELDCLGYDQDRESRDRKQNPRPDSPSESKRKKQREKEDEDLDANVDGDRICNKPRIEKMLAGHRANAEDQAGRSGNREGKQNQIRNPGGLAPAEFSSPKRGQ
jgi:hypothetical protein